MRKISDGDINLRVISESMVFKTAGPDEVSNKMDVDR